MPISRKDKVEFKKALNLIMNLANNVSCNHLSHRSGQYHTPEYACPREYELCRATVIVHQYLKNIGVI